MARRSSVVGGAIWMVVVTLLLFWLPVLNGLVGGFVGGLKVGGVGRALLAAVLPAVVVAVGLWSLLAVIDAPRLGAFAGLGIGMVVLLADLSIFVGALIGGAISGAGRPVAT
jgi:hypothetical protein